MPVPWGVLVSTLPVLIESAGKVFKKADETARKPEVSAAGSEGVQQLAQRLEAIEDLQADQAMLLKQAIERLQQMAEKSAAMERRAYLALGLAGVGTVLALVAVLALVR